MNICEGFPQVGCPDNARATCDLLGYELCDKCADNWRKEPTREDEHTGAQIIALQAEIARLRQALDTVGATIYTQGRGTKMEQGMLAFIRETLGRE